MDVKGYFRKIKELEQGLGSKDVIVCSNATGDGGKEGVFSEVSSRIASQLIVETRARLASAEEAQAYRAEQAKALQAAEEAKAAQRIQVHLLTSEPGAKKK